MIIMKQMKNKKLAKTILCALAVGHQRQCQLPLELLRLHHWSFD